MSRATAIGVVGPRQTWKPSLPFMICRPNWLEIESGSAVITEPLFLGTWTGFAWIHKSHPFMTSTRRGGGGIKPHVDVHTEN